MVPTLAFLVMRPLTLALAAHNLDSVETQLVYSQLEMLAIEAKYCQIIVTPTHSAPLALATLVGELLLARQVQQMDDVDRTSEE